LRNKSTFKNLFFPPSVGLANFVFVIQITNFNTPLEQNYNQMKKILFALSIVFLLSVQHLNAQTESEKAVTAKFLIDMGIEYGGDELLTVVFTNGEDQTMLAGQGGYIAAGGQIDFENLQALMFRFSIGIKYNTTAAENANIRLTRLPINIMPYWKISEDVRLGVGLTTHQSVKFKGDGFVPDVDFTSTMGPRVELGYKWAALTYTAVNYEAPNGEVFNASSFGFSVSFTLPN
jgi:hypothetical protein